MTVAQQFLNMMIIGGSGKSGLALAEKALESGYKVTCTYRKEEAKEKICALKGANALLIPSIQDTDVDFWTTHFRGIDVVVWMINAEYGKHMQVWYEGGKHTIDAAKKAGVPRYIMLSVMDTYHPDVEEYPSHYNSSDILVLSKWRKHFILYRKARYLADEYLAQEGGSLIWTIIRPSALSSNSASDKIFVNRDVHFSKTISRENLSNLILKLIPNVDTNKLTFDVCDGQLAIDDAIPYLIENGGVDFMSKHLT